MIDPEAMTAALGKIIDASKAPAAVFTAEVIDQIGDEFGFPAEFRDDAGMLLEAGAREYASETRRAALDFARIRKELHALDQAAKAIASALSNLSPDAQQIMDEAGFGRSLVGLPVPRVSVVDGAPILHLAPSADQAPLAMPLADVRTILAALGQCAVDARPAARASRKGRPDQQGLWDLLHMGFQVWASLLRRPFKLDWASDGEPITDAARFSVRIAKVVDPALTLSQITTASRKVREMSLQVSDLSELPIAIEHYRKQFE